MGFLLRRFFRGKQACTVSSQGIAMSRPIRRCSTIETVTGGCGGIGMDCASWRFGMQMYLAEQFTISPHTALQFQPANSGLKYTNVLWSLVQASFPKKTTIGYFLKIFHETWHNNY